MQGGSGVALACFFLGGSFCEGVKTSFIYNKSISGTLPREKVTDINVVFFIKSLIENGRFYKNITKMINFKQNYCIVENLC